MTAQPHPTFDFSKVVDTHVSHTLTDSKLVVAAAWVQGQIADAEAHASAYAPDSVSQTLTDAQTDLMHTTAYSESISATNGAYANWIA
jgi:hypothetical protein